MPIRHSTLEEYLAIDRASDQKHEYFRGSIYAMTGVSETHSLIAANCIGELRERLKTRRCRVYTSDMRVKCPTGLFTYPDVSALCGSPELEAGHNDILTNPTLIIEVLSPSTESYDRGKKFEHYRSIPSLRDYVVIPQDRPCLQRFSRCDDGPQWRLTFVSGLDATMEFPSLDVAVPLAEIHANVAFPPEELSLPESPAAPASPEAT